MNGSKRMFLIQIRNLRWEISTISNIILLFNKKWASFIVNHSFIKIYIGHRIYPVGSIRFRVAMAVKPNIFHNSQYVSYAAI
jgi:hypothetical protein